MDPKNSLDLRRQWMGLRSGHTTVMLTHSLPPAALLAGRSIMVEQACTSASCHR